MNLKLETLEDVRDWHTHLAAIGDFGTGAIIEAIADNNRKAAKIIDAHLSAQAKVRVTQVEVDRAWDIYTGVAGVFCSRDGMRNVLEDFAARLSQGAQTNLRECTQWSQGAQGAQCEGCNGRGEVGGLTPYGYDGDVCPFCRGTGEETPKGNQIEVKPRAWLHVMHREDGSTIERSSTSKRHSFGRRGVDYDYSYTVTSEPLYTHPAERAAVPDEWMMVPREPTDDMLLAGQSAHYQAEEAARIEIAEADVFDPREKPGTMRRRKNRAAHVFKAMLTAAPQPPEGARVVDGWQPIETAPNDGTLHVRALHVFSSTDGRFLYWDAVAGHIDTEDGQFYDQGGDMSGWSATDFTHWHPLPAAPTLAGKEGA